MVDLTCICDLCGVSAWQLRQTGPDRNRLKVAPATVGVSATTVIKGLPTAHTAATVGWVSALVARVKGDKKFVQLHERLVEPTRIRTSCDDFIYVLLALP